MTHPLYLHLWYLAQVWLKRHFAVIKSEKSQVKPCVLEHEILHMLFWEQPDEIHCVSIIPAVSRSSNNATQRSLSWCVNLADCVWASFLLLSPNAIAGKLTPRDFSLFLHLFVFKHIIWLLYKSNGGKMTQEATRLWAQHGQAQLIFNLLR